MTYSRADVLREYEDFYAKLLALNPRQRESIEQRDAPEHRYRWRVKLECGCFTEALTQGEEHAPDDGTHSTLSMSAEPTGDASKLLFVVDAGCRSYDVDDSAVDLTYSGILWCSAHDEEPPVREIARWIKSKVTISKKGRHYLRWKVLLSCGHLDHALSNPDWSPEQGHSRNVEMYEKYQEMINTGQLTPNYWHKARMINGCAMEPETHTGCFDCVYQRRIISYDPVGPLTWTGDPERPSRALLQRRLKDAEARRDQLQHDLAMAEAAETEARNEYERHG
jgi:hypothetical protein